jgi:hypothetical protein
MSLDLDAFARALDLLPEGFREGAFEGRRWGVTLNRSPDGRRRWLWGEELGGPGRVSANVYRLEEGLRLLPCEMPAETVVAFVLGFRPDG